MVGKEKVEKMLRQCADTAEMPGWNDALTVMTESVQKKAEALSDDELFSQVEEAVGEQMREQYAQGVQRQLGSVSQDALAAMLATTFAPAVPRFGSVGAMY